MLYMLDTNICIYLIKKHPISYFKKLEKLQEKNIIAISSIVLSELQYGVSNSQHKKQNQINLNAILTKLDVMDYTDKCAFYYGEIKATLKKEGCLIGGNDLLIASHAVAEDACLITNNEKEFRLIKNLMIENWN